MDSVITVNVTNFITVGLMALIFIFVMRFIAHKAGVTLPAAMAV